MKGTAMQIMIFLFDGITALDAVGPNESLSRLADVTVTFVGKLAGPRRPIGGPRRCWGGMMSAIRPSG
jgi:putative intracellular protease/amidase